MHKAAVINLGETATGASSALFEEIRDYFTSQPRSSEEYSSDKFPIGRTLVVKLVAGLLVRVEPYYSKETDVIDWEVLRGFPLQSVVIKDEGDCHFPAAGVYEGESTIKGASATVSWHNQTAFQLSDESVEGLASALAERTYSSSLRVEQPALSTMRWSATVVAPTLSKADRAYAQLRAGVWTPKHPYANALPVDLQARVIRMAAIVREADED